MPFRFIGIGPPLIVPTPIVNKDHVLIMELIGGEDSVAPMLKDSVPENPEKLKSTQRRK